jgi:CTP-dependent riboflavin kinase
MASKLVRGTYIRDGNKHSKLRPKLYQRLGMYQGTINIQLPAEIYALLPLPNQRVPGLDPIDSPTQHNQDFLVRRCKMNGAEGYQVLPVHKTSGEPRGLHAWKLIEITLKEEIKLRDGEELEFELQDFDD